MRCLSCRAGRHRVNRRPTRWRVCPQQARHRRACRTSAPRSTRLMTGLAQASGGDRNADLVWLAAKTSAVSFAAAKALASQPDAGDLAFWVDALHGSVESHRRDDPRPAALAPRLLAIEQAARGMALATEFGFLRDTRSASCCRSASCQAKGRWIPTATTCWRRRRAWPASWPSPRATSRLANGSARPRRHARSPAALCWCPGRDRCSNT